MRTTILCYLMLLALMPLRGQKLTTNTPLQLSLSENITFDQGTSVSIGALKKSLVQVLNKNNYISISNSNNFLVIEPYLNILTKDITPTAPPMVAINFDLSLSLINILNGDVYHSTSLTLKGVGTNENKAYINAFKTIRYRQKDFDAFIKIASDRVGEFYDKTCERVFTEVDALKAQADYDGAMYKLRSIPSVAQACHQQAVNQMEEIHLIAINEECSKYLNIAETAIALRRFEAAAHAIVQIPPEADCYQQANQLKTAITKETGDLYERIWAYKNKSLELAGSTIDSKYKAVAEVYKAENSKYKPAAYINPGNGGTNITTVNVNGTRESGQSPTPVIDEKSNSVQFKIVSPAVRATSGEVVVYEESIVIYGVLDDPNSAQTLTIDGLETSWDRDGVFSRTVSIPEAGKDIQVKLFDKKGEYATQIIPIKKVKKPVNIKEPSVVSSKNLKKKALVIGNSNYQHLSKLTNPKNDADDMSELLNEIGFKVTTLYDADFQTIRKEVAEFASNKDKYDVTLFFFAGHGVEIDGNNYLMPVDVKKEPKEEIEMNSLAVNNLTRYLEITSDNKLNIIILDACRNNPFENGSRSVAENKGGLARVTPATGMLIAYATSPGSTASDGTSDNGLYTGELVKQMAIPQRIEDVFMNTRNAVEDKSSGQQKPWEEARLRGVFYLKSE